MRRSRLGLFAAVGLPAATAGATVLLLSGGAHGRPAGLDRLPPLVSEQLASSPLAAYQLARAAEVQAGTPLATRARGPRPAPPRSISIPSAGVEAHVEPVAAREGALRVPEVGRAGWYEAGPRPGEVGRAVIIGHLDTREGPGLFARVPSLEPGAAIAVTDRRGTEHRYTVIGTTQVEKRRFPANEVYGGARAPVLVLVTCGGPFVKGEGYRDNVLLYAKEAA